MKNLILGLLMIIVSSTILSAQSFGHDHAKCGTISTEFQKARIKANKKAAADENFRMETIYLPIKFHRVGDTQGNGQIKVTSVLDMMCRLKREYEKYDIIPYISNGFNDVYNTGIFFDPIGNDAPIVSNKDDSAANVFITENADTGSSSGGGTTLGFYAVPFGNNERDYIIVRKKEFTDSTATLEHELGHLLSLDHTFSGWEGTAYSQAVHGNPLTITNVGGTTVELVNRDSNCETAGDQLCDTAADYNFVFPSMDSPNLVAGCNMIVDIFDRDNDLLVPPSNNIMSYYTCANQIFTEGQVGLMMADFNSPERENLRSSYIPNLNEITEVPTTLSPGASVDIYNSVQFNWTPVDNADSYVLEITSSDESYSYITTEPNKLVTDLSPDQTYFWVVAPYNETSTCIRTGTKILSTGDIFSSVETLSDVADVTVYPNPINLGANLQIQIDSKESFTADFSILGIDGKEVLMQKGKEIKTNNNLLEIPTESIAAGMYILQIRSERGVFSKQIVIK